MPAKATRPVLTDEEVQQIVGDLVTVTDPERVMEALRQTQEVLERVAYAAKRLGNLAGWESNFPPVDWDDIGKVATIRHELALRIGEFREYEDQLGSLVDAMIAFQSETEARDT